MARSYVPPDQDKMLQTASGWRFLVEGTGFEATLEVELDHVPQDGYPVPLLRHLADVTAAAADAEKSAMPRPAGETATPGG